MIGIKISVLLVSTCIHRMGLSVLEILVLHDECSVKSTVDQIPRKTFESSDSQERNSGVTGDGQGCYGE